VTRAQTHSPLIRRLSQGPLLFLRSWVTLRLLLDVLRPIRAGRLGESNVLSCACWQMTRKGTHLCCAQAAAHAQSFPRTMRTILTVQLRKYESGRAEAVPSLPLCAGSGAYCVLPAPRIGAANTSGTPLRHRATPEYLVAAAHAADVVAKVRPYVANCCTTSLLVALVTSMGLEKLSPPSVDCTQKVSTSEFAAPLRRKAAPLLSVATRMVQERVRRHGCLLAFFIDHVHVPARLDGDKLATNA